MHHVDLRLPAPCYGVESVGVGEGDRKVIAEARRGAGRPGIGRRHRPCVVFDLDLHEPGGRAQDLHRNGRPGRFGVNLHLDRSRHRDLGAGHGAPEAQRAWRELHLLSQLRLTCLPHVHDYDEHEGRLYIVTDYVDGLSLAEYCHEHKLDREARVKLLAAVADCVQTLHEHGVIHRDVKPANIIINPHGQPIIIDLGIAALLTDDVMDTLTAEGAPIGSPAFMAPEQARGDRNTISTRSDVYSLGATAYYILTGEPPHDMTATIHEAVRRVAQDEPRDPRELDRTLPKPLAAVLWKAVSPKPADRYASASAFAADLRRWLNREPVEAGGLTLAHRIGRLIAHHPITTTATACLTIALLVFAATYVSVWYLNARPHHIELTPDGREARLMSYAGRILHTWETEAEGGIRFAQLVDRAPELGGGQIALVAFSSNQANGFPGCLCAFDVEGALDEPLWARRVTEEDTPARFRDRNLSSLGFSLSWADVVDVFPEHPGDEVLAIYHHAPSSAACLRIYGLDGEGELLYQIWHDGVSSSHYWMSDARLLLVSGLNSEVPWAERNHAEVRFDTHPYVVYAVRPQSKYIATEWLPSTPGPSPSFPVWYKCLLPPQASELVLFRLMRPLPHYDPNGFASVSIRLRRNPAAGLWWVIDEFGAEVPDSRGTNDGYKGDPNAPDETVFYLGELPPIISATE
ncbi:MAG: serine/threonine protein kinase [Planctomycetes bacterium]|nr:serine/threonine protein kinase [Planctomycetota bacterium]